MRPYTWNGFYVKEEKNCLLVQGKKCVLHVRPSKNFTPVGAVFCCDSDWLTIRLNKGGPIINTWSIQNSNFGTSRSWRVDSRSQSKPSPTMALWCNHVRTHGRKTSSLRFGSLILQPFSHQEGKAQETSSFLTNYH